MNPIDLIYTHNRLKIEEDVVYGAPLRKSDEAVLESQCVTREGELDVAGAKQNTKRRYRRRNYAETNNFGYMHWDAKFHNLSTDQCSWRFSEVHKEGESRWTKEVGGDNPVSKG